MSLPSNCIKLIRKGETLPFEDFIMTASFSSRSFATPQGKCEFFAVKCSSLFDHCQPEVPKGLFGLQSASYYHYYLLYDFSLCSNIFTGNGGIYPGLFCYFSRRDGGNSSTSFLRLPGKVRAEFLFTRKRQQGQHLFMEVAP